MTCSDRPTTSTPTAALSAQPRHVAVIMDGNGRWATEQGLDRSAGHLEGAKAAANLARQCADLQIEALTLYAFSTENWKRPQDEIDMLMEVGCYYLQQQRAVFEENNMRFRHIGRKDRLTPALIKGLEEFEEATARHTGTTIVLAIDYGARYEITQAVRQIAHKVQHNTLTPDELTDQVISDHLYTAGLPDPDLLIRTAGEYRLSNFLLWQLSYAELYVTDVYWPDFTADQFDLALADFTKRQRRFGNVPAMPASEAS